MMTSWAAAAILVCSNGDPATASAIEARASALAVDPALMLAIACFEHSIKGPNPMGVWGCYPARKKNRTQIDCINLAMESWIRRKATHKTDNKALRAYNNTRHRVKYADTVSKIADKIRKVHAR